jgi:hypothetical protein
MSKKWFEQRYFRQICLSPFGQRHLLTVDIKNCLPHDQGIGDRISYEQWFREEARHNQFKPFGCIVYAHVPKKTRAKLLNLVPRANKGCFMRPLSSGTVKFFDFTQRHFNFTHDLIIQDEMFPSVSDFKKPPAKPPDTANRVDRDEEAESDSEDNDDNDDSQAAYILHDMIIVEQPPEVYATNHDCSQT